MAKLLKSIASSRASKKPVPGKKMSKEEARNYVFTKYRETMELLAKH